MNCSRRFSQMVSQIFAEVRISITIICVNLRWISVNLRETFFILLVTIPSVTVDVDGNISLRGSESVTVLINGRPSVMAGAANLNQMPASLIERIEVITNPSAKYRPDGTGGIINLRKEPISYIRTWLSSALTGPSAKKI